VLRRLRRLSPRGRGDVGAGRVCGRVDNARIFARGELTGRSLDLPGEIGQRLAVAPEHPQHVILRQQLPQPQRRVVVPGSAHLLVQRLKLGEGAQVGLLPIAESIAPLRDEIGGLCRGWCDERAVVCLACADRDAMTLPAAMRD
jgi:hypothetical protein